MRTLFIVWLSGVPAGWAVLNILYGQWDMATFSLLSAMVAGWIGYDAWRRHEATKETEVEYQVGTTRIKVRGIEAGRFLKAVREEEAARKEAQ